MGCLGLVLPFPGVRGPPNDLFVSSVFVRENSFVAVELSFLVCVSLNTWSAIKRDLTDLSSCC